MVGEVLKQNPGYACSCRKNFDHIYPAKVTKVRTKALKLSFNLKKPGNYRLGQDWAYVTMVLTVSVVATVMLI